MNLHAKPVIWFFVMDLVTFYAYDYIFQQSLTVKEYFV